MDRRTLLGRAAAVAVPLSLAGCTGGGEAASTHAFEVSDFETAANDEGNLVVQTTVSNVTDARQTGTLYVKVGAGGKSYTRVRELDLPAAGTQRFDVSFDVAKETFTSNGTLDFEFDS